VRARKAALELINGQPVAELSSRYNLAESTIRDAKKRLLAGPLPPLPLPPATPHPLTSMVPLESKPQRDSILNMYGVHFSGKDHHRPRGTRGNIKKARDEIQHLNQKPEHATSRRALTDSIRHHAEARSAYRKESRGVKRKPYECAVVPYANKRGRSRNIPATLDQALMMWIRSLRHSRFKVSRVLIKAR